MLILCVWLKAWGFNMDNDVLIAFAEGVDIEAIMRIFDLTYFEVEVIILSH